MSPFKPTQRRGANKVLAVLAVLAVFSAVPITASAAVPDPEADETIIQVQVRGDADPANPGTPEALAGVQLRLHADVNGVIGDPLDLATYPWAICTSDADGDCVFIVPDTGGANAGAQFWVVQEASPGGWYSVDPLRTGRNTPVDPFATTPYQFQTPPMAAGDTFTSGTDFMGISGNPDGVNTDSSGLWQQSRANPDIADLCGLSIALVLDLSMSITDQDLTDLKTAGNAFVDALEGTPSSIAVYTFATNAPAAGTENETLGLTPVATPEGAQLVRDKIDGLNDLDGNLGFTNWDGALLQVAQSGDDYDAVLFVTDGNPTAVGDGALSPLARTRFNEIERGIFSANAVKAEGTRIYGVGILRLTSATPDPIPDDLLDEASLNLQAVSGTTRAEPGVENPDYFLVRDYAALGQNLRDIATQACEASVSVVKQVIPAGGTIADAVPGEGWTFTATSEVPVTPATATTPASGAVSFSLDLGDAESEFLTVTETLQDGFELVPQDGANAVCTRLDDGTSVPVTNVGALGFTVETFLESGVTCQVFNQELAAEEGEIQIVKTPSSTLVPAGTEVTYTYEVTNTGDVPLSNVTVVDDRCSPVDYVRGDTNRDDLLDLTETWEYTCVATITQTTTNVATATGVTPDGDTVEDTDTATVTVPAAPPGGGIAIEKTPSRTTVPAGTEVTYTYEVTNTGDVPLSNVTVVDDRCSPVDYVRGDTNRDDLLDLTETWEYTCVATITQTTTNIAVATGQTPAGDTVRDEDTATVIVPAAPPGGGIAIDKTPSSTSVTAGTAVTYTYLVTNTGEVVLADITVSDDKCSPVSFVSGDTNGDQRLDLTETWTYTCTATITQTTTNVATTTGVTPDGDTVEDTDTATVTVPAAPPAAGIAIKKTPSSTSVTAGTAVTFTYQVTNTGAVALSSITVSDDKCSPVSFVSGDTNGDQRLDLTETWTYTCTSTITQTTTNVATTTGVTPDGETVQASDTATVTVQAAPVTGKPTVPVTGGPAWTLSVLLSGLALVAFGAILLMMRGRRLGA